MGIYDRRQIFISAGNEEVYEYIDTMPQKFPTLKILDSRLILFLRTASVSGLKTGAGVLFNREIYYKTINAEKKHFSVGESLGAFTLIEADAGKKYFFSINAPFLNGKTGYILIPSGSGTVLCFDTISENPAAKENFWWHIIKPFHIILANIVLRNIKNGVELRNGKNDNYKKMHK